MLNALTTTTNNLTSTLGIANPLLCVREQQFSAIVILLVDRHTTAVLAHLFYNGHEYVIVFLLDRNKSLYTGLLLEEQERCLYTNLRKECLYRKSTLARSLK